MALTLYFHPLSSFCQKVLIALYENGTPFTPHLIDLFDEKSRAELLALWPVGRFPVLRDDSRNETIPESSIIIEHLERHYPGRTRFIPEDPDAALQTRLRDRFYDLCVNQPMQTIVIDRRRAPENKDPFGVALAKARLQTAYGMIEEQMASADWAMGKDFTMADCAAAPALSYANMVEPFGEKHKNVARYLGRLRERPSFARALREAEPYLSRFPKE